MIFQYNQVRSTSFFRYIAILGAINSGLFRFPLTIFAPHCLKQSIFHRFIFKNGSFSFASTKNRRWKVLTYSVHVRYVEYLCDVICHVIWILFNRHFYLMTLNNCRPAGLSSVFQFKFSTYEPSEPLQEHYSQLWHHNYKKHIRFLLFVSLPAIKEHQISFFSIFPFNVKYFISQSVNELC